MSRKINYKDFQILLLQNNTPLACQYLESLWDAYTAYMPLSFNLVEEMAKKISQDEARFIDKMNADINKQLENGTMAVFSPRISDFPKNICSIGSLDFHAAMMFKKSVYDFIHWVRICFDILVQFINASLLKDNPVGTEDNAIISKVISRLDKNSTCQNLLKIVKSIRDNPNYQYVHAFDNCTKHIKLIPSSVSSVRISFGSEPPPQIEIERFSHGRFSSDRVDALEQINNIEAFARTTIYQILLEIQNIVAVNNSAN